MALFFSVLSLERALLKSTPDGPVGPLDPRLCRCSYLEGSMLFVYPQARSLSRLAAITIVGGLAALIFGPSKAHGSDGKKPPIGQSHFSKEAQLYVERSASLGDADECVPIEVAKVRDVSIMFPHCSDQAIKKDGEEEEITKNFTIPESLARRAHFWRRIYSIWSIDDFVLHSAEYPEVIMEVARSDSALSDAAKIEGAKKTLRDRQKHYRNILLTMHYNRKLPSFEFDPVMNRLARSMAHLTDPNKYLVVANSLRVQRGQKEFIGRGIQTSTRYLPVIEGEFIRRGLPPELARIAFVESSFNVKAVSKVGASGVYQFMRFTAKDFMTVNDAIDERRDPIKAGYAAARLFEMNYKILGNWPLAITAYNHGAFSLKRAVKKLGSNDLIYLINKYDNRSFGFASKNFYCEFLGLLSTYEHRDVYFPDVKEEKVIAYTEYKLPSALSVAHLRKKFNLTVEEVLDFNPDIDRRHAMRGGILPRGYVFKIPQSKSGEQTAALDPEASVLPAVSLELEQ